jgi:hypothetical protein
LLDWIAGSIAGLITAGLDCRMDGTLTDCWITADWIAGLIAGLMLIDCWTGSRRKRLTDELE